MVSSLSKNIIDSNPLNPKIYGLPNIHKEGAPLRPIINTIDGPTYLLTKFLANRRKSLMARNHSFVKDSSSFIKELK